MKKTVFITLATSLLVAYSAFSDPTVWWDIYGLRDTSKPEEDNAVLLIGQAKHAVYSAYQYLETEFADVGGAGSPVEDTIINAPWFNDTSNDNAPITEAQLKYMIAPLYDRMNFLGVDTSGLLASDSGIYPWTSDSNSDDDPNAMLTIGQLKFAMSFDLNAYLPLILDGPDEDGDGLSNLWELYLDLDPLTSNDFYDDSDDNSVNNLIEYLDTSGGDWAANPKIDNRVASVGGGKLLIILPDKGFFLAKDNSPYLDLQKLN